MHLGRRRFLHHAGNAGIVSLLLAHGFLKTAAAARPAWNKAAFEATSLKNALAAVVDQPLVETAEVRIIAPDIAENGAVVPVGVTSSMEGVEAIAILCEKNPQPLAAIYEIPPGTFADLRTRVKMSESADVVVLIRSRNRYHIATRSIKVTRGGCG
jgi:sulfur-oxidizing protein SoxY